MARHRYIALLRGINVGGNNPVPMADLRLAMTGAGFEGVRTYIQSGNLLFESDRPAAPLEDDVEEALEKRFGVPIVVVVRSEAQFRTVVTNAPPAFGTEPSKHHSDAIFLKAPLTSARAMGVVQLRDGVDDAWPGAGVIYFRRLSARRTASRMGRIAGTPEYKLMTIRSWTTVLKLVALLDE